MNAFVYLIAIYRQRAAAWLCDFPHIRREEQPVRHPLFRNFVTPKVRSQDAETEAIPSELRELPHASQGPRSRLLNTFRFDSQSTRSLLIGFIEFRQLP